MNTLSLFIFVVILLMLLEAPFFTLIGGLTMALLYAVDQDPLSIQTILIEMNRMASMPVLVALPLFTFVGTLLTETGAPRRIMALMHALMGWLPGGLAIAALCSCAFFTALTGASGVTIVALGSVLYPVLLQRNYNERFTLGLLTTSGSRGLLFPPSLPIILYGVVAQIDIALIFKSALVPGILGIVVLSLYAMIHQVIAGGKAPNRSAREPASRQTIWRAFREAVWDLPIILLIVMGVYGGYVTIAEVSALVLVYVVVVSCFILKEVHFPLLKLLF